MATEAMTKLFLFEIYRSYIINWLPDCLLLTLLLTFSDPKSSLKVRANPKCITIMSGENFNFSCETDIIRDVDRVLEWFIEDEDGVSVNKTLPKSHVHGYSDSKLMYSILMIKNAKRTNTVYGCRLTATFHLNLGKTMTYETYVRLNVKGNYLLILLFELFDVKIKHSPT